MTAWIIGDITLPLSPTRVKISNPATIEKFEQPQQNPIVVVTGADLFSVTLEGSIYVKGASHAVIWQNYIVPLLQMRGSAIQVSTPDGQFDGTWILQSFEPTRTGKLARYTYSLKLVAGSEYVIL